MPDRALGVGIIGVSADRGWAAAAHIPALYALPKHELRALTAHSPRAARAAGAAFGVADVFSDHAEMLTRPDLDLVAITVKVPRHRELVSAVLSAGKAVYCEWPLGLDLEDAQALQSLAVRSGARTVVGLQARQAPAIKFVRQLIGDGYIGQVLSTTVVGLSSPGSVTSEANAYMLDEDNGANLSTITIGHILDTLTQVLGDFADLSALSDLRRPTITIAETGQQLVKTSRDQVALIGTLRSGVTASVHLREAVAGGVGLLWEINGTAGTVRISATEAYPANSLLAVDGSRGPNELVALPVPTILEQVWPSLRALAGTPADNVGRAYAAFAADLIDGTHTAPDFAEAVRLHELLAAIERSAVSGERITA